MKRETSPDFNHFKTIPAYQDLPAEQFFADIVNEQHPVVLRGFADTWPMVTAAKQSASDFIAYLNSHYNGNKVTISAAPPNIDKYADKRFFYNDDLTGFGFVSAEERLDLFLQRLLVPEVKQACPALSMQSALINTILPSLSEANSTDYFLHPQPRIWIGNQGVVDTHYDGTDNIACVVAGRRRFVLFPPEQTSNLYPGPLEFTPAGVPVSLVNLRRPDYNRYPKFKNALEHAYHVELGPGDALFIPMLWWHYVESLDAVNGLVNYWWNGSFAEDATSPNFLDSLKIAVFAMRDLTPKQRRAWRCLFDHYLFKQGVDPASYIPAHQHHVLGEMTPEYIRAVKDYFVNKLQK